MSSGLGLRARLALFLGAIVLLCLLIGWAALASLDQFTTLQERLTRVEGESDSLADHFQKAVLGMNSLLLSYEIRDDTNLWAEFLVQSENLNRWLKTQRLLLDSTNEQNLLVQLESAYHDYRTAAARLAHRPEQTSPDNPSSLKEIAAFEHQVQVLFDWDRQLAEAHRASRNEVIADSHAALELLRWVLWSALLMLGGLGAGLAWLIYRELIAPLQLRLVEAKALAERNEKLASLGMLASGVAHEVRNPLTAIKARVFTLQRRLETGSPEHGAAVVIDGEISRLERIVREFLQFARPGDPASVDINPVDLIQDTIAFLAPQMEKAGVQLTMDPSVSTLVRGDPQQLRQVLINLVQNAADATGAGGRIVMRARLDHKRLAGVGTEVVILEVEDNGQGIPPEVEKRLFDPFFTTKESGTGLGLAIAARILEKHQGALQYQTQAGKGTVFGVILPRLEA